MQSRNDAKSNWTQLTQKQRRFSLQESAFANDGTSSWQYNRMYTDSNSSKMATGNVLASSRRHSLVASTETREKSPHSGTKCNLFGEQERFTVWSEMAISPEIRQRAARMRILARLAAGPRPPDDDQQDESATPEVEPHGGDRTLALTPRRLEPIQAGYETGYCSTESGNTWRHHDVFQQIPVVVNESRDETTSDESINEKVVELVDDSGKNPWQPEPVRHSTDNKDHGQLDELDHTVASPVDDYLKARTTVACRRPIMSRRARKLIVFN